MYEGVAEEMLLEYTTPELLRAIQSTQLSDQETEGAARLFGGWEFNQKGPQDNGLIPPELKQMLLKHCLSSTDQDKLARARQTFGSGRCKVPLLHVKYRYGNFYNCPVRRKGISVAGR